jgi:hypothetical protein
MHLLLLSRELDRGGPSYRLHDEAEAVSRFQRPLAEAKRSLCVTKILDFYAKRPQYSCASLRSLSLGASPGTVSGEWF